MNISLGNTFMWFINNQIHLSEEVPGPIELDFSSLNKDHQKQVINSIRLGQIKCSEPVDDLIRIFNGLPAPAAPVPSAPVLRNDVPASADLKNELVKLLGKTVGTVKRNIGLTTDIRKLRLMLELEREHRNRGPIIKALEDKLASMNRQIENNIIKNQDLSNYTGLPADKLADELTITESDFEEVSIIVNPRQSDG